MNKKYNVAVIGATGNVGCETLSILAEHSFPVNKVYAAASANSIGTKISFGEDVIITSTVDDLNFHDINIAFFCAGSEISKKYIPIATSKNCIAIDKSSYFRLDDDVPLIVPEANQVELKNYRKKNIIANPNCCTIPLAVVLKALDNKAKIKRIIISTYQSVSGAGKVGMDELYNQTKAKFTFSEISSKKFPRQIAFNLFPYIGDFEKDGSTEEETKVAGELEKIIGKHTRVSITCVRVPVFIGHSMSVNVEFSNNITALEAEKILQEVDGVVTISHLSKTPYISPIDVVGEDFIYVARIRDDKTKANTLNLWVTCDNLRKGAALNSVQIAEELIKII